MMSLRKYILFSLMSLLFSHVIGQTNNDYPICYWNKNTGDLDSVYTIDGRTKIVTKHIFATINFDKTKVEKSNQIEIGIKKLGMFIDKLNICHYDSLPIVVYTVFVDYKKNRLYYEESKNHIIKSYTLSAAIRFNPDSTKHVDVHSTPVENNYIINKHVKQFFCNYTFLIGIECKIGFKNNDITIDKSGIFHIINWKIK